MDDVISWVLSATAVGAFTASWALNRHYYGRRAGRTIVSTQLLLVSLALVSLGTFIVSTIIVSGNGASHGLGLVVAFNRAVLAGTGIMVLSVTIRSRPRPTRDR